MNITFKDDYTSEDKYGNKYIREIQLDRFYTDEQKTENQKLANTLNSKEWSLHCEKSAEQFSKKLDSVLEYLGTMYNIYNYNTKDFNSDYDYYLWRSENKTTATLTFNTSRPLRTIIYNMEKLVRVLEDFEECDVDDFSVWVKLNNIDSLIIEKEKKEALL